MPALKRITVSDTGTTDTSVVVSCSPPVADLTDIRFVCESLNINAIESTANSVVTFNLATLAPNTAPTNSLHDATLQVGTADPVQVTIQVVEAASTYVIGVILDDDIRVTSSGQEGTPYAKAFLLAANDAQARGWLGVDTLGTRPFLNESYVGMILAPSPTIDYVLDPFTTNYTTFTKWSIQSTAASGTVSLYNDESDGDETLISTVTIATSSTNNVLPAGGASNLGVPTGRKIFLRFSGTGTANFAFNVSYTRDT
tara:strand:+ start:984 stop:1751 length:768 start_codon:yes stop_codon:yes gene_type:complete